MLRAIERATRQVIEPMNLPSVDAVNSLRIAKFKQRIVDAAAKGEADPYRPLLEQLEAESGLPLLDIAAALAALSQGTTPLLLAGKPERAPVAPGPSARSFDRDDHARPSERIRPSDRERPAVREERPTRHERPVRDERLVEHERPAEHVPLTPRERPAPRGKSVERQRPSASERPRRSGPSLMETFRIEVGSVHGIKPGNVVGAIANEAGIEGVHIGRVDIREDHSYVDLPEGMPKQIFSELQKVRVAGRELRMSRVSEKPPKPPRATLGRHRGAAPREDSRAGGGTEVRRVKPKIMARRRAKD
jgi:ATP-dependent RNA helicase DeaD